MIKRGFGLALAIMPAALLLSTSYPPKAAAAGLGVDTFSNRVVLDLALKRAQVRALQKCAAGKLPQARPGEQPPPVDLRQLPLSPPTGTGGPVPLGPNPCHP